MPGSGDPLNACGGTGELLWQGAQGELLESCGAFGEGTLVCGGLDALRCAGESTAVNICGGLGVLPAAVGSSCGVCGDGTWVCAGDGDSVRCLGASAPNVCGGCAQLDHVPGESCVEEGEDGAWVCTDPNTLACVAGAANACGGQDDLMHEGDPSGPGQPCGLACGGGVLVCDGAGALACAPDDTGEPENACGGCGILAGLPGAECGACTDGAWTCDEGQMFCGGGSNANACGGCDALAGVLGEPCDEGLAWGCSGPALECFVPQDTTRRNACGGTGALDGAPGDACGTCSAGVLVCETPDRVECSVPNSAQVNPCGGCGGPPGRVGDPCGTCGSGALACEGDALACDGDLGEDAENACGGCAALPGEPGELCGACLAWECNQAGGLRCAFDEELPGCENIITCADLACAAESRRCIESDGMTDAACGGCIQRYFEEEGECLPHRCDTLSCDEQNRVCSPGPPAFCSGCVDGFIELSGECQFLTCELIGCEGLHRECSPEMLPDCGDCLEGYADVTGECRKIPAAPENVEATRDDSLDYVDVTWSAVDGADGYFVYRDGTRVTTQPLTTLVFRDTAAPRGDVPDQVQNLSASDNRTDGVMLTWDPGRSIPVEVEYVVTAVIAGLEGYESDSATGYRGGLPITGYEVSTSEGPWISAGTAASWFDGTVGLAIIDVGTPLANYFGGFEPHIAVLVSTPTVWDSGAGPYRVRARNVQSSGAPSVSTTGSRRGGEPLLQWQRAVGFSSQDDFQDIPGATDVEYLDYDIDQGEHYTYRVWVEAEGAEPAQSGPVSRQAL